MISCCQEIYTDYYNEEKDIARALLRTCRKLNVVYDEVIVDKTIETLKGLYEKGKAVDRVFSIYKAKLATLGGATYNGNLHKGDLTFKEPSIYVEQSMDENTDVDKFIEDFKNELLVEHNFSNILNNINESFGKSYMEILNEI